MIISFDHDFQSAKIQRIFGQHDFEISSNTFIVPMLSFFKKLSSLLKILFFVFIPDQSTFISKLMFKFFSDLN